MNTVQLSRRLARNLNVPDPAQLDADSALDVLSAINAGLAAFYREMPSIYKQTTISATLRAPQNVNVVFDAKYANTVADDTFTTDMIGCTLRAGGSDNEITGTNSLLDDYLGDALSVSGQVYFDALPIREVIKRLTSDVRLYQPGNLRGWRLAPAARNRIFGWYLGNRSGAWDGYGWCDGTTIGRPMFYVLDPVGASEGAGSTDGLSRMFLLRVFPKPSADYTVRFEAELAYRQIAMKELTTPVVVPVAPDWIEDILVPLCEAELVQSKFWRDADAKKSVIDKRADVITNRVSKAPTTLTTARNLVGTPLGY